MKRATFLTSTIELHRVRQKARRIAGECRTLSHQIEQHLQSKAGERLPAVKYACLQSYMIALSSADNVLNITLADTNDNEQVSRV